jgi:hypothetical protein
MFFVSLAVVAAALAVAPIEASPRAATIATAKVVIGLVLSPSSTAALAGKPNQGAQ